LRGDEGPRWAGLAEQPVGELAGGDQVGVDDMNDGGWIGLNPPGKLSEQGCKMILRNYKDALFIAPASPWLPAEAA